MMDTINELLPKNFSKPILESEYDMLNHAEGLKCNYEPYDMDALKERDPGEGEAIDEENEFDHAGMFTHLDDEE